jgi:hypothetical protein
LHSQERLFSEISVLIELASQLGNHLNLKHDASSWKLRCNRLRLTSLTLQMQEREYEVTQRELARKSVIFSVVCFRAERGAADTC